LAVLTMIAFAVGKAEKTLFENWIAPVPKGKRQAEPLVMIAESGDAILAPSIGAAAGVVVRQVFPRVAVWAVIFTHRAPLALAEICAPFAPQTILGLVSHLLFDSKMLGPALKIGFVHGRMCLFVVDGSRLVTASDGLI